MASYEQAERCLNYWAAHYSRMYGYKLEMNELINAAWAFGDIQKVTNPAFLPKRARFCIKHIVRTMLGFRNKHRLLLFDPTKEYGFAYKGREFGAVETRDFWDYIYGLRALDRTQKEILWLRYNEQRTYKEIGFMLGYHRTRIMQKHVAAIELLRAIIKRN